MQFKSETVRSEFFWIGGLAALSFLMVRFFFGVLPGEVFDINIYDTYFVVDGLHLFLLVLGPTGLLVYLARTLFQRFRRFRVNLILSVFILMSMVWISWMLMGIGDKFFDPIGPWSWIVKGLWVSLAILGILLVYVGYRTGRLSR